MFKRRLLRLAALLEADADNPEGIKFDLRTWGNGAPGTKELTASCNTTACAVGLACLSGEFEFEGLGYVTYYCVFQGTQIDPTYKTKNGLDAAKSFFGLTELETKYLFSEGSYVSSHPTTGREGELVVAARIRHFVENLEINHAV